MRFSPDSEYPKSDWLDDQSKIRVISTIFSPRNLIGWVFHQKNKCYWHHFYPSKSDWLGDSSKKQVLLASFLPLEI